MACCGGKKSGGSSGPEIPTEMKEIKVEKFDELFTEGSEALQVAEDFRAGLSDSKAACMAISGAYTLKVGTLSDAIKCWLWSVCTEVGADKFATMTPKLSLTDEPHFDMEIDDTMSDENKEFMEAIQLWALTVSGSAESIQTISEKLKGVAEKATELAGTAKDECSNAGLSMMDTGKAVVAIGSNTKTLATGSTKLAALGPLGKEALTDMKAIIAELAGMFGEAAKNAADGKGKGAKTAAEFCEKQHPGEKLDAKQAQADAGYTQYAKNKAAGKKLPAGKGKEEAAAAAPAGDDAEPAVAADDVKPELKDV